METTNELDVANNVDNKTLTELEEELKGLVDIFKDLNIKTSTYRKDTTLFRKKCDKLKQTHNGYTLPWL